MSLRTSLVLPTTVTGDPGQIDELLAIAGQVDRDPAWEGIFVADTILALGFHDSTVMLAALAARTSRVRLGVACLSTLGLRQPLVVAQQWANLDALSGGRMTMVTCSGNRTGQKHERERAAFGIGFDEKLARMEDAVEFLRKASTHETVTHRSKFLDLEDVHLVPGFRQHPLPIWMVANPSSRATGEGLRRVLGRVARLGDGWLTYNITPELLRDRVAVLAELRAALAGSASAPPGGHPVAVQVNLTVGATTEQAVETAERAWVRYNSRGVGIDALRRVSAIGTPGECAAFLRSLEEAGATDVLLHPLADDVASVANQVEIAGRQLLPLLQRGPRDTDLQNADAPA